MSGATILSMVSGFCAGVAATLTMEPFYVRYSAIGGDLAACYGSGVRSCSTAASARAVRWIEANTAVRACEVAGHGRSPVGIPAKLPIIPVTGQARWSVVVHHSRPAPALPFRRRFFRQSPT
jgi:hypothetical protein